MEVRVEEGWGGWGTEGGVKMGRARGLQAHRELRGGSGLGECRKESSTGLSLGLWTNLCEVPRTGMAGKKSRKERGEHAKPRKEEGRGATGQSWDRYRRSSEVTVTHGWGGRARLRTAPQLNCRIGGTLRGGSAVPVWVGKELRGRSQAHGKTQLFCLGHRCSTGARCFAVLVL